MVESKESMLYNIRKANLSEGHLNQAIETAKKTIAKIELELKKQEGEQEGEQEGVRKIDPKLIKDKLLLSQFHETKMFLSALKKHKQEKEGKQ